MGVGAEGSRQSTQEEKNNNDKDLSQERKSH